MKNGMNRSKHSTPSHQEDLLLKLNFGLQIFCIQQKNPKSKATAAAEAFSPLNRNKERLAVNIHVNTEKSLNLMSSTSPNPDITQTLKEKGTDFTTTARKRPSSQAAAPIIPLSRYSSLWTQLSCLSHQAIHYLL